MLPTYLYGDFSEGNLPCTRYSHTDDELHDGSSSTLKRRGGLKSVGPGNPSMTARPAALLVKRKLSSSALQMRILCWFHTAMFVLKFCSTNCWHPHPPHSSQDLTEEEKQE